ncbi:MAG TPA: DUF447 domain-containing protein [Pirellulales bacterium]|nr:DUF447 domain-containing protein [Pirellulales bacterium]
MTTLGSDGRVNIAPMGPIVDAAFERLTLRPYQTSTTYANLKRSGQGVFHVTDNVLLIAQAAIGAIEPQPETIAAESIEGRILADCCRWYALRVESLDDRQPRTEIVARVVDHGTRREFFGFNRAKHAVLEAAIVATRLEFLSAEQIRAEFGRLAPLIDKTGGDQEHQAFRLLDRHVRDALAIMELNRPTR